MQKRF
jgi:hypothetical protein